MDINGAAWAKVIAYVGSVAVLWWYIQRVYPVRYDLRRIGLTMVVTGVIYGISLVTPSLVVVVLALPAYVVLLLATRVIERSTLQTLIRLVRR